MISYNYIIMCDEPEARGLPLSILAVDVIQNHAEPWLDSWFDSRDSLLILVHQIKIYISRDNILQACTKIYRNNSGSLIPDSRIM